MMMSGSGRSSRFPFTASQWQELEHQALVFKYMVSGMPIPPDLLFTIRRSLDSSLSSKFLIHQPQHPTIGWNSFHMGFGRKIDPEPGRCRRTDGKKWRCSKEAYPDSKYCERHMHRGRNRSRKPVEVLSPSSASAAAATASPPPNTRNHLPSPSPYLSSPAAPSESSSHFLYPHFPSSRPPASAAAAASFPQESTNFFLEPNLHSRPPPKHFRHGMKAESDEHPFFSSEPLTMEIKHNGYNAAAADLQKIQSYEDNQSYRQYQHERYTNNYSSLERAEEQQPKKVMHHFLEEWAPKETESERTQLSISVPNSLHDFFVTQKW